MVKSNTNLLKMPASRHSTLNTNLQLIHHIGALSELGEIGETQLVLNSERSAK